MDFVKIGFGQVEPNHLSAQRTAQIYAQLPAAKGIEVLENGQFVKYDYAAGQVDFDTDCPAEWMLVFNEVKLYDDKWRESYADFALQTKNAVDGVIVPRVFKTNIGDIYTTNCLADGTYEVTDIVSPNAEGFLAKDGDGTIEFQVVKETTMPDGKDALKLMRVK